MSNHPAIHLRAEMSDPTRAKCGRVVAWTTMDPAAATCDRCSPRLATKHQLEVAEMFADGAVSKAEVARRMGVSRQRVQQIVGPTGRGPGSYVLSKARAAEMGRLSGASRRKKGQK